MANWVIRRKADGLYWNCCGWRDVERAYEWDQSDRDMDALKDPPRRLCQEGEEWVELDAAGQPVEAAKPVSKPKRLFVMRSPSGLYHMGCGDWTEHIARAMTYAQAWTPSGPADVMVPVLVHPDGTVTLDEPAPAVAQPSPEDEPIPYRLAADDDVQIVASTSERIGVLYAELTRMTAEVSQLERQRDEAAARLRGGE